MKVKVTDVITMAWNDHRISLENDDIKVDVTVKNTVNSKNPLLNLKRGHEVELFGSSGKASPPSSPKKESKKSGKKNVPSAPAS